MKLLYITQMYPSEELPQYCIFLHLQVKALIRKGVEVTVVIPTVGASAETVYDGVDVIYLHYKEFSRSALYGIVTSALYKELRQSISLSEYDIVYAIHAQANILDFARVVARREHKPLVVHYRGYNIFQEYTPEPKAFLNDPEKVKERVVKASALSIGVSQKTVDVILQRFPNAPVEVVYNGVDAHVFSDEVITDSHDDVRILCVANLIPIKGHKYLFDAVKTICKKNPDTALSVDIVGRGKSEEELKEYVAKNQIPGIRFHGYVHHDEVARFMQSADIVTLPSVYESFGNVCLEAMSCKKPVVIFAGQGIDELLEDGVSGMIAEKGNLAEYTDKLEQLVTDPKKRQAIAENGYRISKNYTWDKSAESIIGALEKWCKR